MKSPSDTPPPAMGAEAKMREAFEAWVRNELGDDPKYWQHATEWAAWQEAARLAVERAAQVCDDRRDVAHGRSKSGAGDREIELCSAMEARCCADAIRALTNESEKRHG